MIGIAAIVIAASCGDAPQREVTDETTRQMVREATAPDALWTLGHDVVPRTGAASSLQLSHAEGGGDVAEPAPVAGPRRIDPPVRLPEAADWRSIIRRYDWPAHEAEAVVMCESRGWANAYSAGNYGLFQINQVHSARVGGNLEALFDAETNVAVAYAIYRDNHGWSPWACRP